MAVLFSSCTGLGKLTESQYLVTKNKIEFSEKPDVENFKKIKIELKNDLIPKPNGKLLWMRPALAFHNTIKEPKKKSGFKYWLKYKIGKPPALLSEETCKKLNLAFENRLYHKGFFNAKSEYSVIEKNKTAQITFLIDAGEVYRIDTLIFPPVSDQLTKAIDETEMNSLLVKGAPYSLDLLKSERERIDNELKNQGFFFFDKNYLLFLADSSDSDHLVKLKLVLKNDNPAEAGQIFRFNKIMIAEDFNLEDYQPDTTDVDDYTILSEIDYMKPKIFLKSVLMEKGEKYSMENHNNSIRQLARLNAYKYVNINYTDINPVDSTLSALFLLSPSKKMSISTEVNATAKSNDFIGPGIKLSYKSRNLFRAAEVFSVNLNGNYEQQISGAGQGDTAYEISMDATLELPRYLPFKLKKRYGPFLPRTLLNLGVGVYARVSLYKFNTFAAGLEYDIKKSSYITHVIRPIDISKTDLSQTTPEFEEYLNQNPSIKLSFDEQFIIGFSYNFIINRLMLKNKPQYYVNLGIDPSGNLIGLMNSLVTGEKTSSDNQIILFGSPLSEYTRFRADLRYYFKTGKESMIATRLYGGFGIPYGSSTVMPYIKQFYVGGTNGLRAFRARSVGPGTYQPADSLDNLLVDQTGEIKMEANIEYRFPIMKYLKGALFTDFGNIWLFNADSLRPGGQFNGKTFYNQMAGGMGFGLRVDFNVVVIRFDWAVPIRKPWLPAGQQWTFRDFDMLDSKWRKENFIWNIAIGYPF